MKRIQDMTIEEKIGQLLCVGFQGVTFSDNLKYIIDKYKAGNIILFTRNIKDAKQLFNLNKEIHQYVIEKTGIMPFISIDQEGGMVTRIMDGATFCPGNMTLATSPKVKAYEIGKVMGKELRALGINMNLAPSLDVNNNPNNPVIGVRSYSDNPYTVSEYGLNYIRGLQEEGVVATAKHFPGHGDTSSDSHKSLPVIAHCKERLNNVELVPFKKVLNEVKAIMSAHVFFPAYEEGNLPGTLSKKVITDLLRNDLGYKGLIVSDCMEMKAIDDNYTTAKGCLMGLLAGLDQVMVSATYEKQVQAFETIYQAVKDGILTEEIINEKVNRIIKAKEESYKLMKDYFYGKAFDDIISEVDNEEHKKLAQEIVDKSLTKVKGNNINKQYMYNKQTLIITTEPFATTIAEDELSNRSIGSAVKEAKLEVDVKRIKVSIEDNEIDEICCNAKKYMQVIVCTYNANQFKKQAELINKLDCVCNNLFVISTRCPYDIYRFRQIKNYLCLYEYTPNSVNTIIKYFKGELLPLGKLPISLKDKINVGASVYVGLKEYPLDKNLEYLELLKKNNIEYVFISAHIPEMNESFKDELVTVCEYAANLGIKVCLDVSKTVMTSLTIPKVYALRLDYGFTPDEIVQMFFERKYVIELNASTISCDLLDYLKNNGVNLSEVRISHNFYPKKYTGLDSLEVITKNRIYHKYGMKVMIYIPSSNMKRPPMYEGLPTVEAHRDLNLYSILSTIRYLEADEVFFGDSYASASELVLARDYDYDTITLPIMINSNISVPEKELLRKLHSNRIDAPIYFVRSSSRSDGEILPLNTIKRDKYDVTIDNVKFGRYQGEVCIMKTNLEADLRVNVVGKAIINDDVLMAIYKGCKFKFVIIGEYD